MSDAFSLFRTRKPSSARPIRPTLEALESRDCPSFGGGRELLQMPPQITSFSWTPVAARQISLQGRVMDDNLAGVTINFGGKATGSVTPDANGDFSLQVEASGLGEITAIATDSNNLSSAPGSVTIGSNAPSLTLTLTYGANNQVTVSGYVNDEWPGGQTVTIGGKLVGSETTWSDGHFDLTGAATGLGAITATTVDCWGLVSQPATVQVVSNAPEIVDFEAWQQPGGYWEFSGRVIDESPAGLTVTIGGLPYTADFNVQTDADGEFTILYELAYGETGTATAKTKDWWQLDSNIAMWLIN